MGDLDINSLLNALENETNASIMRLNSHKINKMKNDILQKLQLEKDKLKSYHKKLNIIDTVMKCLIYNTDIILDGYH